MTVFTSVNDPRVVAMLNSGAIGIIRTDTLYGVLARANDEAAVNKVYDLKSRDEKKSPIVLINDIASLFDTVNDAPILDVLKSVWPGAVSVILPSTQAPIWIRRDNDSVAYRIPANDSLRTVLKQTGPLIAPSANPEGQPPAMNLSEAQVYFGDRVDFYVDGGQVISTAPSQLLQVHANGEVTRLR